MPRDALRFCEKVIYEGRSPFIARKLGLVAQPQFAAGFGDAGFVAEHDNLNISTERDPTAQRIALDDANMSGKRLWCREKGKHNLRGYLLLVD
jgi:hypothetical protein